MQLTCPDCRKPITAENVNINLGLGKCLACNAVFNVLDQIGSPLRSAQRDMPLSKPKHYRVEDFGPDLTIRWSWYNHAIWLLVFFAIIWDGFLLFWYAMAFQGIHKVNDGPMWLMLVFPLIHVAVGVGITYACLLGFINRTELKLARHELSIWHGPLPCTGNRRINPTDIRQLFCAEKYRRTKHGGTYYYSLNVLLNDGERICLINNILEATEVLYLERVLEERLQLPQERVPGDWVG
jgi:hypothetical protein